MSKESNTFNLDIEAFSISIDKTKLQIDYIHQYLSNESYWAKNIPIETVKKSINGSLCFGIYLKEKQVGFARVITDEATFAYLADVFIDENYRGLGLSKKLMAFIMDYLKPFHLRKMMLATRDAHNLYAQYGFDKLLMPDRVMEIKFFDQY